ncbi:hypothetical protein [Azospirillum halopraeferens]|uniref:hypothetical protein n=1 Tax=Azospirillum halopraeferens TaxID=34010 RepID=UPI0004282598|nr:hypothetical protein [Azospirillum halopraeferens]
MIDLEELTARTQALSQRFRTADDRHRAAVAGARRVREQARLTCDRIRHDRQALLAPIGDPPPEDQTLGI